VHPSGQHTPSIALKDAKITSTRAATSLCTTQRLYVHTVLPMCYPAGTPR
jgi:hypothetical protein